MDVIKVIGKRMSLAHPSGKYKCVCACGRVHMCVHTHVRACMYPYVHVHVNACKHPFIMAWHKPIH